MDSQAAPEIKSIGGIQINNISKYVVCPYYITDKQGKISCEGIEDKTYNHLVFENCLDKKPYMMKFCCDSENYMNCRICEMLDLKWAAMEKISVKRV